MENLAEVTFGDREPHPARSSGGRAKRLLAAWPPAQRGAGAPRGSHLGPQVYRRPLHRIGSLNLTVARVPSGRWLGGRKRPPAKRVGGVELPRGFESLPSRQRLTGIDSALPWTDD